MIATNDSILLHIHIVIDNKSTIDTETNKSTQNYLSMFSALIVINNGFENKVVQ